MTATEISRAPAPPARKTRLLDPVSRTTEVLFGLIMVLTFTASLNASEAGREDVRLMLIGAIGCCLAWGLIDGAMYLLSVRAEKAIAGQALATVRAASPEAARLAIAEAMPPLIASLLDGGDFERLRLRLMEVDPGPEAPTLTREDWLAACAVFLLVFLSTIPIALPFLFIAAPATALWFSHAIALVLLFAAGFTLGTHWNRSVQTGAAMVTIGVALVGVALALGG
jgi:VIT1/CCC1 family predicted Fe2+/Mn2+ transporter